MKIAVLGGSGMLGQMVCRYFSRPPYDIHIVKSRYSLDRRVEFLNELEKIKADVIINCIGAIKQKTTAENELYTINSLLPLDIINAISKAQTLVHPSTDCVFDGLSGAPYNVSQKPQAQDAYGHSKALGEAACMGRENVLLMRTSIIGLDNKASGKGLLRWFLSQPSESKLSGYENHYWNGVTTFEWCKQVETIINSNDKTLFGRVNQLSCSDNHSKYGMLRLFQDIFGTNFEITKFTHPESIDRRLVPTLSTSNLKTQLQEMKDFWK